jgi:hypothetical protein
MALPNDLPRYDLLLILPGYEPRILEARHHLVKRGPALANPLIS